MPPRESERKAAALMSRPVFVVRFRPLPGTDAIRALRATLKCALRQHGLRCIDAREEGLDPKERDPAILKK